MQKNSGHFTVRGEDYHALANPAHQSQVTSGGARNASRPIIEATIPNSDDDSILGISGSSKSQITGEFTDFIGVTG